MFEWIIAGLALFIAWRILAGLRAMDQSQQELIKKALADKFMVITIEENEDGFFAYHIRGEFLAHGITYEKMTENFRARFPGKTGLIAGPNATAKEI